MFKLRNILFIEIKIKIYILYSTIQVKKLQCVTSNINKEIYIYIFCVDVKPNGSWNS